MSNNGIRNIYVKKYLELNPILFTSILKRHNHLMLILFYAIKVVFGIVSFGLGIALLTLIALIIYSHNSDLYGMPALVCAACELFCFFILFFVNCDRRIIFHRYYYVRWKNLYFKLSNLDIDRIEAVSLSSELLQEQNNKLGDFLS